MRFYEVDGGTISIDGRDITSIPRSELRGDIGMVLQDTWLFSGTIRDNIAYGNPDATDDQLLEAARATYVDRFVHSLPDGYDTVIDDEGSTVSAGEKQLITIARAFLADPHPHPGRGHQLGGHPHRGAHPAGHGRAALQPHELRHRAPLSTPSACRHHPRDGLGADRTSSDHTSLLPQAAPDALPGPVRAAVVEVA
jgi:hypothetical protein